MNNYNRNMDSNGQKIKKKKLKKIFIIEIILLILAVGALLFVFYFEGKLSRINRTEKLTDEEAGISKAKQENSDLSNLQNSKKHLNRYETVVLYGVDSRKNQLDGGTNSDVMIIVSIDHEKKQIRLLSVYRDTYMDNGAENNVITLKRANSAYLYGYKRSIRMLNRNLDLNIKDYVTASFAAVTKAVDAFGGIELEITDKEARQINRYLAETASVANVRANFLRSGGKLTLDGAQATTYARIRKGVGDDYSRANRQRIVIKKLFEKAKKFDLIKLNNAMDAVLPLISTNFDNSQIIDYLKDLATYDIVDNKAFPFDFKPTYVGRAAVIVPINLEKNVKAVHEYLYPDSTQNYEPSQLVKDISSIIMKQTGVNDNTQGIDVKFYNGEDANTVN